MTINEICQVVCNIIKINKSLAVAMKNRLHPLRSKAEIRLLTLLSNAIVNASITDITRAQSSRQHYIVDLLTKIAFEPLEITT